MLVRKIFRRAVIELCTAIVTEYDPRKHTDISTASRSALVLAKLLDDSKGFSVNDSRVSILKYLPIFFGNVYPRFILERLGCVTEIDRVAHILLFLQEICNRSCYPPSGNSWRGGTFVKSNIVNNLCKDIVYTFELQLIALESRKERSGERLSKAARCLESPNFAVNKLAGMYVKFCNSKISVTSNERIAVGIWAKFYVLVNHRFA